MSDQNGFDDYDEWDNGDCWNCGGEGFVSNCFTEYACIHPDEGCDECTRRCDICNPVKLTAEQIAEHETLRNVLGDLLARAALTPTKGQSEHE